MAGKEAGRCYKCREEGRRDVNEVRSEGRDKWRDKGDTSGIEGNETSKNHLVKKN